MYIYFNASGVKGTFLPRINQLIQLQLLSLTYEYMQPDVIYTAVIGYFRSVDGDKALVMIDDLRQQYKTTKTTKTKTYMLCHL